MGVQHTIVMVCENTSSLHSTCNYITLMIILMCAAIVYVAVIIVLYSHDDLHVVTVEYLLCIVYKPSVVIML